jgi:hypothetical protein
MAMSKKARGDAPVDVEVLLPWYAAGTLSARDARRVDKALAQDPNLAMQYAAIREEQAETILLNESLGVPSLRAMQKLFSAIDAEALRSKPAPLRFSTRVAGYLAGLSPRTLTTVAAVGALVLMLQGGVVGVVLMNHGYNSVQTASLQPIGGGDASPSFARSSGPDPIARALIKFKPEARMSDITGLLDSYQASIIDSTSGGVVQLRFSKPMSKAEISGVVDRLKSERIVGLAVAAQ